MRTEQDIFHDLLNLCGSPGYVHALAFICFKDGMVAYVGQMTTDTIRPTFSKESLIRTEISTLIGLLLKEEVDYSLPNSTRLQEYVDRTYTLLEDLHESILSPYRSAFTEMMGHAERAQLIAKARDVLNRGEAMREPIFYSGESAYSFQYRDLSVHKYASDNEWLLQKKGFSIQNARDVVHAVTKLQEEKLRVLMYSLRSVPPTDWTLLPGFSFTAEEVARFSGIESELVHKVLDAFTVPSAERNEGFRTLHDFNIANAAPLLRRDEHTLILFQQYSLLEALYEAPYYWMVLDRKYAPAAMEHRGRFTEEFSKSRLTAVFGRKRVHNNVNICKTKSKRLGEIDVLVLFGNRAIVLQAKSKRLTLEARRGNDGQIRDDFKKSIQDAYDQGWQCAQLLNDSDCKFLSSNGEAITVPRNLKEIYLFCVVTDHYPALSFQVRHFLKAINGGNIKPPFVMDVFTLDATAEMLQSPLHFLSYVNKRTSYSDKLLAGHELIILSYHLKKNLWLDEKYDLVTLEGDFSADLDAAMSVRRDNIPGKRTPDGILTRVAGTSLGRIVKEIEFSADPQVLDLGFMLLTLSENAYIGISEGIDKVVNLSRKDGKPHDLTVGLGECGTGLTIHCNSDPIPIAARRLAFHCSKRKYAHKENKWFGICLEPSEGRLRFGMNLDYRWEQDEKMDNLTRDLDTHTTGNKQRSALQAKTKVGRNEPCPCGSGQKYKKCHGHSAV